MSAIILSNTSATLTKKDPGVALTTLGMISSREEPIMNFSTQKSIDYHSYLKSSEWKLKKNEWVASGRPLVCWACGDSMPLNRKGFQFHHRTYKNLGNEDLNDLVLLCATHHRELEEIYKTNAKANGVSLESWTYIYISMIRIESGLKPIRESHIAQYMGAFDE
jgi:hypothetical protein